MQPSMTVSGPEVLLQQVLLHAKAMAQGKHLIETLHGVPMTILCEV